MSAAHAPTPWRVMAGAGVRSCRTNEWIWPEGANAEFIVKAANAHDDLVEALRSVRQDVINLDVIDAALSKAELGS